MPILFMASAYDAYKWMSCGFPFGTLQFVEIFLRDHVLPVDIYLAMFRMEDSDPNVMQEKEVCCLPLPD